MAGCAAAGGDQGPLPLPEAPWQGGVRRRILVKPVRWWRQAGL